MSAREHPGPLFARLPRASHRHDPLTSLEAERDVSRGGGSRGTDLQTVLDAVRHAPGQTASGYASMLDWDIYRVRRRLSDLSNPRLDGGPLIRQGEPVMARGRSKREVTWLPL